MPEFPHMNATDALAEADLIMFDLDGTLVDSVPDLTTAVNEMLDTYRLPACNEYLVRSWVGNGARKLIERTLDRAGSPSIGIEQALTRFLEAYQCCNGKKTCLYPGASQLLMQLADRDAAIVTNKPYRHTIALLEKLEIIQHFSLISGGDTFTEMKPSALPLTETIARHTAKHPIFVGDSVNDVKAAKSAGVAIIAVSYGYNHGRPIIQENPDWVVDSLFELL